MSSLEQKIAFTTAAVVLLLGLWVVSNVSPTFLTLGPSSPTTSAQAPCDETVYGPDFTRAVEHLIDEGVASGQTPEVSVKILERAGIALPEAALPCVEAQVQVRLQTITSRVDAGLPTT